MKPLCGFPWHGLLRSPRSSPTLRVGDSGPDIALTDVRFPETLGGFLDVYGTGGFGAPPEEIRSSHIVKVPGVAELDLTEEEESAQTALGRAWRNHALLCGSKLMLNGKPLGGWICIDPDGAKWLIKPSGSPSIMYGNATIGSPLTLGFTVRPFGYFGMPAGTPTAISATLADIEQGGETLGGEPVVRMRPASIASHGREVIIALYPKAGSVTVNDFPCGWLRLELTGNGPSFGVTLSVIRSRTATIGTASSTDINAQEEHILEFVVPATASGLSISGSCEDIDFLPSPGGGWMIGTHTVTYNRTGVVLSMVFDEADAEVLTTADLLWTRTYTRNTPTATSVAGSLTASFPPGQNESSGGSGEVSANVNRTATLVKDQKIVVYRDAVAVDAGQYITTKTLDETVFVDFDGPFITATLSPPVFTNAFSLSPIEGNWSMLTEFKVNGLTAYSHFNGAVASGDSYSNPWNVQPVIAVTMDGPYPSGRYQLSRASNQVIQARHAISIPFSPFTQHSVRVHALIAARAEWYTPDVIPGVDTYSITGCYNPVTHELTPEGATAMHI